MIYSVLRRTLREGVTFEQFREAWRPPPGLDHTDFTVVHGRSLADPREILSIGMHDMTPDDFVAFAASDEFTTVNEARHEHLAPLVEEGGELIGAYEVLSTDQISL
jgi:hypothetical protein